MSLGANSRVETTNFPKTSDITQTVLHNYNNLVLLPINRGRRDHAGWVHARAQSGSPVRDSAPIPAEIRIRAKVPDTIRSANVWPHI